MIEYTADTGNWTLCAVEMDVILDGGYLPIGGPQSASSYSNTWTPPSTLRGGHDFGLTAHLGYYGCDSRRFSTIYSRAVTWNG